MPRRPQPRSPARARGGADAALERAPRRNNGAAAQGRRGGARRRQDLNEMPALRPVAQRKGHACKATRTLPFSLTILRRAEKAAAMAEERGFKRSAHGTGKRRTPASALHALPSGLALCTPLAQPVRGGAHAAVPAASPLRVPGRGMASRRFALLAAGGGAAAAASVAWPREPAYADGSQRRPLQHPWENAAAQPAARSAQLAALRRGGFDVLVIGGACAACVRARRVDSTRLRS